MEEITTYIDRMCRACMCKDQNFHSIMEYVEHPVRISEMLATTTPQLLVQAGDMLPELICNVCLNKLNISYHFQQMCITSDKRMRAILMSSNKRQLINESYTRSSTSNTLETQVDPLVLNEQTMPVDSLKVETSDRKSKEFNSFNLVRHSTQDSPVSEPLIDVAMHEFDMNNVASDSNERREIEGEFQNMPSNCVRHTNQGLVYPLNINNETSVDEIAKPDARNRRNGPYPCPDCGKIFDRPYRLRRHEGVHSGKRPYECDVCKTRFSSENQLKSHKLRHIEKLKADQQTPTNGYKCLECPRRFEKLQSLSAHMQSHPKAEHRQHGQQHANNQKYSCHMCEKLFAFKRHLLQHLNKHKGLKSFICVYCDKAFQQNFTLKEHLRTHTGEKPFLCSHCGKAFQNGSNMRQHILRHSVEKRYQCPECPSKFACQSDKIKHMSIHRVTKPHVCDVCGSSFSRSYTLSKHKYIHTGLRPYKCEECNMTFVFIDHMRRHMRTHTGEKPYRCRYCDRAYAESGDLNKHMRSHVGENTYKCKQCLEAFKYQAELRTHQMKHYREWQKTTKELSIETELKTTNPL